MKHQDHAEPNLLDPRLLRLFDALFTTGSVTKAAERLGQSQPTVSIWLARLRKELDDPLFIRSAEGMLPTSRAEALIGTARQALEMLRRLAELRTDFDPATAKRRFSICMTDGSHVTLLPSILAHVRRAAPGVRIEATQIGADTSRMLQSGEADLALGYISDLDAGHFWRTQNMLGFATASRQRVSGARPMSLFDPALDISCSRARYSSIGWFLTLRSSYPAFWDYPQSSERRTHTTKAA